MLDLITDLATAYSEGEENYFCGSIVLVKNKEANRFDIIDGQQRITTFIILSCVIRDFYADSVSERAKRFTKVAVQDEFEKGKSRLVLLTDEKFQILFEQTVLNTVGIQEGGRKSIENRYPNNKYLQNAHYLKDIIKSELIDREDFDFSDFMEWVFKEVWLTSIICPNEDSAIQIFNVLNDRGIRLSPVDILKSSFMRNLSNQKRKAFKASWDEIQNKLESNKLENKGLDKDLDMENLFTTYLYYTITRNTRGKLHKELLEALKDKDSFAIMHELSKFTDSYITTLTSQDKYTYCLRYLNYSIYWQAILTAANYENSEYIKDLKRLLLAYYYQNWIAGGTAARIKHTSFQILGVVKKKESISEIQREMRSNLYKHGTTKDFIGELKNNPYLDTRKWAKPVLLMLEYFLKDSSNQPFIPLDKNTQIEHILPKKPNSGWSSFTKKECELVTGRLGNLTLLSGRKNTQGANSSFEKKKEVCLKRDKKATSFELTRQVFQQNNDWNNEILKEREKEMIDRIIRILELGYCLWK